MLNLLKILAIGNIVGKLFTGWFSGLSCIDPFMIYNIYICCSGISVLILPFCSSYLMYAVVVAFYGFFTSFIIHESIVIVQILGLDNLTSAFGLMMVFQGEFHFIYEH